MVSFALTIVRHGQTDSNITGRHHGQTDVPLNDTGRRQAEITGQTLQDVRFSHAVSSDLNRAKETCKLILAAQKPHPTPVCDIRLRERSFGELEGCTKDEIHAMRSQGIDVEQIGEPITELAQRTHDWFIDLCAHMHLHAKEPLHEHNTAIDANNSIDSHVLAVSHWGAIVQLFKHFEKNYNCKFNVEDLRAVNNTCISQFIVRCQRDAEKGGLDASIECLNSHDISHLEGIECVA